MSNTVLVSVLVASDNGAQVVPTAGQLVWPGLAITPRLDEDNNPTDLFTLTHQTSGVALLNDGMCEICIHFAAINRSITELDWTRTPDQLCDDPDVHDAYFHLVRTAWLCARPCTLTLTRQS